jgi:uncharacterized protein YbbK (DUF523 family)
MQKLLVSSCLLGNPVRYNGTAATAADDVLSQWVKEGRVVAFCPELAAGFAVPRNPVEIMGGDGANVLRGEALAKDVSDRDVTLLYIDGAKQALTIAQTNKIKIAILKDGSPSCGSSFIYDGTFSGRKLDHSSGVTAALLRQNGVEVFSELEIDKVLMRIAQLEARR